MNRQMYRLGRYLGYASAYYSASDRQKVSCISRPWDGVSGQLWTHWETYDF